MKGGIGIGLQAWQVREAVRRFGPGSVTALAARTLIPRAVFHRRLIELERRGFVTRDAEGRFRPVGELAPGTPLMHWHIVDGSTFESLSHCVRRIVTPEPHWRAERKEVDATEPRALLPGHYPDAIAAQRACEADEYKRASGR